VAFGPSRYDSEIHMTGGAARPYIQGMRVLLALLAVVGLLLTPVAAAAATPACLHASASMAMDMAMPMAAPHAQAAGKAAGHPCCDDGADKPVQHDSKSCAQACAVICGVSVAVTETAVDLALTETHARVEPAAPRPLHAHAPPGLKRPPKQDA
jgi:hypothetical protein